MNRLSLHLPELSRSKRTCFQAGKCYAYAPRHRWAIPNDTRSACRYHVPFRHVRDIYVSTRSSQRALGSGQNHKGQVVHSGKDADALESLRPETLKKSGPPTSNGAPNTDGLLSEQTVSNKEQRKADWAIIKEMAQYLWPKVGWETRHVLNVKPNVEQGRYGHKGQGSDGVGLASRIQGFCPYPRICRYMLKDRLGPQCSSPFLFQKHRRFS